MNKQNTLEALTQKVIKSKLKEPSMDEGQKVWKFDHCLV